MPGPPPTPHYLRLIRGNPSKRRLHPEVEPMRGEVCPEPPSFLTPYGQDEWRRVAGELHQLRLLTVLEFHTLAAYCDAYARWRSAVEALQHMAVADAETRALTIKSTDGKLQRNPLIKIAADAAADMVKFASHFGMTAAARSRLAAGVRGQLPDGGKFGDLLR